MSRSERLNTSLQSIVELGIILDAEHGAVCGWMFMQQKGVSEAIILRVLADPNRRRASDMSALDYARRDGFYPGRPGSTFTFPVF